MATPLLSAPARRRVALTIVLGWALVVSGIVDARNTGSVLAQAPDPCALLKTDEIQSLVGNGQEAGNGVPSAIQSLGRVACRYQGGAGVGRYTLDVIINSNMTADAVKQALAAPGGIGTVSEVIDGVGEAAAFKSDSHMLDTATASMKGRLLQLNLDGYDARAKKDQVISLLKTGSSRL
jgi:hypothetical protein